MSQSCLTRFGISNDLKSSWKISACLKISSKKTPIKDVAEKWNVSRATIYRCLEKQ
ncbi:helix-turn-helix domain-containing protein [Planococcus massiliensis]|uniref:helix-turn-helix domain-containing protein n=1 Tax=Planococcus massiliensis TaxID=1499687 RepID=UPI001F3F0281|nr:helix-turn-helix domain-containing protein [Planococcus massiliensis]